MYEKLMHNRLNDFLEKTNNLIYLLLFGLSKNSITNALIHLSNLISESLIKRKFVFGTFVHLQKVFNTVHQKILFSILDHYVIGDIVNEWFETYLCNRKEYVSIHGFNINTSTLTCHIPQGSVLGSFPASKYWFPGCR